MKRAMNAHKVQTLSFIQCHRRCFSHGLRPLTTGPTRAWHGISILLLSRVGHCTDCLGLACSSSSNNIRVPHTVVTPGSLITKTWSKYSLGRRGQFGPRPLDSCPLHAFARSGGFHLLSIVRFHNPEGTSLSTPRCEITVGVGDHEYNFRGA